LDKKIVVLPAAVIGGTRFAVTPAHAASGQLTVTNGVTGQSTTYRDPAPGCYRPRTFDTVINRTDRAVTVFADENCRLGAKTIQPGSDAVNVGDRLSIAIN